MAFALSTMVVTSPSFEAGGRLPDRLANVGGDSNPGLAWSGAPDGTRSFAVICHDPDAPHVSAEGAYGVAHWCVYNIPATTTELVEGERSPFTTGPNQMGDPQWIGPKPPPGHGPHHYVFWVLALGREPTLEPGLSMWQLLRVAEPDVLGMSRLVGTFDTPAA